MALYKEGDRVMAGGRSDQHGPIGETDEHLLLRARLVRRYEERLVPPIRSWPVLYSVLIRPPKHAGDRWLVVLKATTEAGDRVGFHKGSSIMSALAGALQRVYTGKMDWKVETPYRDRNG